MGKEVIHPNVSVLCKLGSIVVHLQEASSKEAHIFDLKALIPLIEDVEVKAWIKEMDRLALVPKKR